jgi:signal peptidase I
MPKDQKEKDGTQNQEQQYSTLREYFVATVYCTIIALFVTTYVVHPMTVPTPSMEPTIMVGDRLLIDKFTFRNGFMSDLGVSPVHQVDRGDIVVFKFPEDPEVLYVKRAIGLPGEILEIRDKTVYINGVALDEPYKVHRDSRVNGRSGNPHMLSFDIQRDNFGPVNIPDDSYFMMGDNRDDSADSRYFGFLQRDYIVGRPLVVFWSYEDDSDAYLRTSLPEMLKLYGERIIFFFTKTRWSRMGHFVK